MMTREEVRTAALQAKNDKGLTWPQLGQVVASLSYCLARVSMRRKRPKESHFNSGN